MNAKPLEKWILALEGWSDETEEAINNCGESDKQQERADWLTERLDAIESAKTALEELVEVSGNRP